MVSNVVDDLSQMQNTGESVFKGIDLSFVYQPASVINLYTTYSYIQRKNISNPDILFTDVPNHKLFASVEYIIAKKLFLSLSGEYDSERNNASDGTRVSPGFFVMNAQASYHFRNLLLLKRALTIFSIGITQFRKVILKQDEIFMPQYTLIFRRDLND